MKYELYQMSDVSGVPLKDGVLWSFNFGRDELNGVYQEWDRVLRSVPRLIMEVREKANEV